MRVYGTNGIGIDGSNDPGVSGSKFWTKIGTLAVDLFLFALVYTLTNSSTRLDKVELELIQHKNLL